MTSLALTNEKINSYGGLTLAGRLLSKFCRIGNYFKDPEGSRSDRIPNADILTSMIGLLALIGVACKVVSHAGRKVIKIASCWPWSGVLMRIDRELA